MSDLRTALTLEGLGIISPQAGAIKLTTRVTVICPMCGSFRTTTAKRALLSPERCKACKNANVNDLIRHGGLL
ncbi:hypothetical protein ACPV5S_15515 [Vibrio astriarenae]